MLEIASGKQFITKNQNFNGIWDLVNDMDLCLMLINLQHVFFIHPRSTYNIGKTLTIQPFRVTHLILYSSRITSLVIIEPNSSVKVFKPSYNSSMNLVKHSWIREFYQKELFKSHFRRK